MPCPEVRRVTKLEDLRGWPEVSHTAGLALAPAGRRHAGGGLGVAGRRRWKLHGATGLGRLGGVGRSREGSGVGCPEACRNARESICAFSIRTEELMEF